MEFPKRLFDIAYYQLRHKPLQVMMTSKQEGKWKEYSTEQVVDLFNCVSRGLLKLGINPGDKIALISHNNRSEWNIMDLGILQIGGIDVPIYPTMTSDDYKYILNHSESRMCFVSNEEIYQKVMAIKDEVPGLEKVYCFETVAGAPNWTEVIELGKDKSNHPRVEEIAASISEKDLATIIYTSGTTGVPKGVMLSHQNITSNTLASTHRLPKMDDGYSHALSFLPVCHIYERMMHYLYMYNCVSIYFAESLETIKEDLNYSQPQAFSAVPRLLEKFYDGIVSKGTSAGGIKKQIFLWAVNLALKWKPGKQNGSFYEFQLKIARKLVFSKVKSALGLDNIKAVSSGSAALQPRLASFFNGAGIPVYEGYGLTETSPVITVNTENEPNMLRIGSVGKVIEHVEIKIAEDGEVLCKGPNVMLGYYKDQEKTDEVLKDGWFHTGDIGVIEDEFLKITDRKKEIFKTSGGKYIAPQLIENSLKESLFIEQVMVVGESEKFPAALIVPNFEVLKSWCQRKGISYTTNAEMINEKVIFDRIMKDVTATNQRFGHWEQIKAVRLLQEGFSIERGELTPTMKLKRKPIMQKYAELIHSIYN